MRMKIMYSWGKFVALLKSEKGENVNNLNSQLASQELRKGYTIKL
jgi:hypothetical protein